MRYSKWIAIAACIIMVLAAYTAWDYATGAFNPYPLTTKVGTDPCGASACGTFGVLSANVTVINSTDITSQFVDLAILPGGSSSMARIQVYLDNVSIGTESGSFPLGKVSSFELGVPTTIVVTPGETYTVEVQGVYQTPQGQLLGNVWVPVVVVAHGR